MFVNSNGKPNRFLVLTMPANPNALKVINLEAFMNLEKSHLV